MSSASDLIESLMALDSRIRAVEVRIDGRIASRERPGVDDPSPREPDGDGQLPVNPAAPDPDLHLEAYRGGGARDVVIRRGRSWQLAMACRGGHVSIGLDRGGDPLDLAAAVSDLLLNHGL